MKSRNILIASLVTLVFAGVFLYAFLTWRDRALYSPQYGKIQHINQMESHGVPNFKFKDSKTVQELSELKGKVVIVNFWASWCGPCVEEIPSMIDLVKSSKGSIKLVAVSQDQSADEMNAFLKAFPGIHHEDIFLVWDPDKEISSEYLVERLPESFIVGPDFKLKRKIIGTIDWNTPDAISYLSALYGSK